MDEMVAFLARRLRSFGLQTAVLHTTVTPGVRGRLGQMLVSSGIDVVTLDEPDGREWLRRWAPDVVSAHGAPAWVLDECRSRSVPYVETLHGMHSLFDIDWKAEAARNRGVTAIVAVSELVRRQYLCGAPQFPADRVVTIPNGVDSDRRERGERAMARAQLGLSDEFLFVCLARHCLQKNTYGLIRAFAPFADRHPAAHLLIAGRVDDASYFRHVRALRDAASARDRIHLVDHVPEPGTLLAAADAFVLDSFFEGWSLASMEALHAGLPVVASDVGGAREQLGRDGERGYLVPNPLGDPLSVSWTAIGARCYAPQVNQAELVTAMASIVRDREHWTARRELLAAESERRFHPDRCARAHAELLHACVARRAASVSAPA